MRLPVIIAALLAASCASSPATQAPSPQTSAGHDLLEKHCASCHGVGRFDSSQHPAAPPFRKLSRSYPVSALEESLAEGIMVGHPDMPEFRFNPEDVAAIISYLESIQQD